MRAQRREGDPYIQQRHERPQPSALVYRPELVQRRVFARERDQGGRDRWAVSVEDSSFGKAPIERPGLLIARAVPMNHAQRAGSENAQQRRLAATLGAPNDYAAIPESVAWKEVDETGLIEVDKPPVVIDLLGGPESKGVAWRSQVPSRWRVTRGNRPFASSMSAQRIGSELFGVLWERTTDRPQSANP